MTVISAGFKHQGKLRPHNEDNFLIDRDLGLYAVADGVEAEPCGEVASQMAVDLLGEALKSVKLDEDATPPFEYAEGIPLQARALKFAFREANRRIHEKSKSDSRYAGMCTTLSAVWFQAQRAFIANVGDSRVYMIRKGNIQQLTHDHTSLTQGSTQPVAPEFLEQYSPISEHELTKAVGLNPDMEVQLAAGTPKPGDSFILCTDGLYEDVRNFELMDLVKGNPPDVAVKKLIALANERGGKDNVAVIVINVT